MGGSDKTLQQWATKLTALTGADCTRDAQHDVLHIAPFLIGREKVVFSIRRHPFHHTKGKRQMSPKLLASPITRYRCYPLALFKTFQGFCQCGRRALQMHCPGPALPGISF